MKKHKFRFIALAITIMVGANLPVELANKEYATCQMQLPEHSGAHCNKRATKKVTLRNTSTGQQATIDLCDDHTRQIVEKFRNAQLLKDRGVMSI